MSTICDDLRSAILLAAMQGKLTKQLVEDGNAAKLVKDIADARDSASKKPQKIEAVADEEKILAVPDSWSWVRVGEIFSHNTGKTKNASQNKTGELRKYITTSNLYWNFFDFSKVGTMYFKDDEIDKYTVKKGDLLVCEGGDFGRTAIWDYDEEVCFQNHVHRLRFYYQMNVKYFYWLFYYYKHSGLIKGKGIGIQGLSSGALHNIAFPLPPLAEQNRIVEKVDELMARVADLEKSADALASLMKAFPSDIKAALLRAAMQGKLTKQLSEDGDASDLLEQIKTEKEKLIAEGKIRKQKALAPIAEDEIPFDIPENWQWARLGDLTEPCEYPYADGPFGSNLKKEHYTSRHEVRIIQLSNIGEGGWKDKNVKYTTYEHLKTIERSEANSGDIVIAKMMPAGRAMIVPDIEECYVLSSDAVKIVPNRHIDTRYLERFLNSPIFQRQVYSNVQGVTRVRTSLGKLIGYLVAVPPLAEQKRIVERLDALMQNIEVVGDLIATGE